MLYVTTPNIDRLPGTASREFNPHHLVDFTPATLEPALRTRFAEVRLYGQTLDESLERVQVLLREAQQEWAVISQVEHIERAVRRLPGPIRVRLRRWWLRVSGIRHWPLPEAEAARDQIRAEDFRATEPAESSGCTIAVCRR